MWHYRHYELMLFCGSFLVTVAYNQGNFFYPHGHAEVMFELWKLGLTASEQMNSGF